MKIFNPPDLSRPQYFIRFLIWTAAFFGIPALNELLETHNIDRSGWSLVIAILVWLAVKLLCLDAPRLRNIGWSSWLLLLFLFPLAYFFLQIFLFTRPSNASASLASEPHATGSNNPSSPSTPPPILDRPQKIPTFIYAFVFFLLCLLQFSWTSQQANTIAHGNAAIASGYMLGQTIVPLIIIAGIASIWRPNRGIRGVIRVFCYTSLLTASLKFTSLVIATAHSAHTTRPQPTAVPAVLSAADKSALLKDAGVAQEAVTKMDVNAMINNTPDDLFNLVGKEAAEQQARSAMSNLAGIKFLITEFHDPTNIYKSDKELICFLPRTSMLQVKKHQVRSIAYWVAVRKDDNSQWKFLDGADFQNNPQLLNTVFPALPDNIRLPEWKQELAD